MIAAPIEQPAVERFPEIPGYAVVKLNGPTVEECSALRVAASRHWIADNGLYADLVVENRSDSAVVLPGKNRGGHYWDAVLFDREKQPITYSSGVQEVGDRDWELHILAPDDLITIPPHSRLRLPSVYLAPAWPHLRREARSFQVLYWPEAPEVIVSEAAIAAAEEGMRSVAASRAAVLRCHTAGELQALRWRTSPD